ncbi:MAG: LysR family transcriptional regulator [SAR324 cluster bacterium]|nr:LysR family transcriptional regulator [SAR324 cluster bacterium]
MEMHQVRYFLAVCDTLNFTRAAELCHVSQPSLTQAIKKLEDELGGDLFVRERNRTRLTEMGVMTRPHMEQIYSEMQSAKADAHHFLNLTKAPLRMGVMVTIGPLRLAPFLAHFKEEYPGIELELHEGKEEFLLKRLMAGSLDLAVTAPLAELDAQFAAQRLYTEKYVVVFPPGHRYENSEKIRLKDVSREPYLDRLSCELRDMVMEVCEQKDIEIYATYRSEREDWIQGMVMARLGVAFMPQYSIVVAGICSRPLVEPEVSRQVQAVTLANQSRSPALDTMLKEVRAWNWTG